MDPLLFDRIERDLALGEQIGSEALRIPLSDVRRIIAAYQRMSDALLDLQRELFGEMAEHEIA